MIISLNSPLLVGIYEDLNLIKEISNNEKTSEALPLIFQDILKNYKIDTLFYAKGPGSFMSIKITYIFLKTISITKNCKFLGCDGFYFNNNTAIKAVGNRYFVKNNNCISLEKNSQNLKIEAFKLPKLLDLDIFSTDVEPLYFLPAV